MQRNPHSYQIATGYRTFYSLSLIIHNHIQFSHITNFTTWNLLRYFFNYD